MPYCPECAAAVPNDAAHCPTCGSSLVTTPTDSDALEQEQQLDVTALEAELSRALRPRYELLNLLGVGGMGAVFLAREPALKRLVAVKVMSPSLAADHKARQRFEREATAAAQLSHPNVVRVYAVGETKKQALPYIVMQYVQGVTLAAWLSQRKKVSERDARRIIGEVAAGLAAAHARDLVHRDVKPGNVLLETDSGRAYVADFGVSAALSPGTESERTKLTATGVVIGTPVYMSPEQAAGDEITPKSDVYSLGMLAYELVTGEFPFSASSAMGWVAAHMRDTPTPLAEKRPDLSPEVLRLIDRCLAKDPAKRPTVEEVATGMLPSLETEVEWPPPGLARFQQRTRALGRILGVATIAGLALVFIVALTPEILQVHQYWLSRLQVVSEPTALIEASSQPDTGEVSLFVWQTVLVLASIIYVLGAIAALGLIVRYAGRLGVLTRLGWRFDTLLDVAGDADGRSGRILGGSREFASLETPVRRGILRARRARLVLTVVGVLWVVAGVGAWAAAAVTGFLVTPELHPLADFTVQSLVLGPAIVVWIVAIAMALRERRVMGPLAKPRKVEDSPEDVVEWYAATPGSGTARAAATPPRFVGWRRAAGWGLGLIAALLLLVVTAEVVIASLIAARFVQAKGPETAELITTLDSLEVDQPLVLARDAWEPLVPSLDRRQTADTVQHELALLVADTTDAYTLPSYPREVARLYASDSAFAAALREALQGRIPADTVRLLEQLSEHPRTLAFRQVALADSFDLLAAQVGYPIEQYGAVIWLRIGRPRTFELMAHVNVLTGLRALARGEWGAWNRRLGENAAFAEKMLRDPSLLNALRGMRMLRREVLRPAAVLAEARGDSASSARYRHAAESLRRYFVSLRGSSGLAANPADLAALERLMNYSSTLPGQDMRMLTDAPAGLCGSPREILTGPSQERLDALTRLVEHSDLPHARELDALSRRTWTNPIGSILSGRMYRDRGWLEHTPLASGMRILMCYVELGR